MSDTCGNCKFCAVDYGTSIGHCFGLPPAQYQDGRHFGQSGQPPQVKTNRRGCFYHKLLADGETNVNGKSQDNLNREFRQAHREQPAATDPIGLIKDRPKQTVQPVVPMPKSRKPVF